MGLQIDNLEIRLGSFHLGPISYEFGERGLCLIRGKNGAGKTSLLKALMGRLRPSAGKVIKPNLALGAIGIEGFLMGSWTVEENALWLTKLLNQSVYFDQLGLPASFRNMKVDQLSLGMKRRVELSLAIHLPFPILLLDEPFTPLDEEQRKYFALKVSEIAISERLVLLTTHHEDELYEKPTRVLELS